MPEHIAYNSMLVGLPIVIIATIFAWYGLRKDRDV